MHFNELIEHAAETNLQLIQFGRLQADPWAWCESDGTWQWRRRPCCRHLPRPPTSLFRRSLPRTHRSATPSSARAHPPRTQTRTRTSSSCWRGRRRILKTDFLPWICILGFLDQSRLGRRREGLLSIYSERESWRSPSLAPAPPWCVTVNNDCGLTPIR